MCGIWFNYAKNQYLAAFLMPSEIRFPRSQPKSLNFQDILDILYEMNFQLTLIWFEKERLRIFGKRI